MNHTTVLKRFVQLAFLCFLSVSAVPAQSGKPVDENQVLQALLSEVRLLRKTMQRTGLNAYRSQIILERIKTSNDQVERMKQSLEQAREDTEKIEQTIPRLEEQQKLLETHVQQETDIVKRAKLEFEHQDMKRSSERYKVLLTRAREREQQLATELRTHQARLGELEGRLDLLEREIANEIERLRSESKQPD